MNKENFLLSLTQEVLLPVMEMLEKKVSLRNVPKVMKKLKINAFSLLPFSKKAKEEVIKAYEKKEFIKELDELGLKREDLLLILSYLNCQLRRFIKKHHYETLCQDYDDLFSYICEILNPNEYNCDKKNKCEEKDDFFEIDSNQDENIKKMHYTDEEKISAKEFMEDNLIDADLLDEIEDLLEDYENISAKYEDISKEFLDVVSNLLSKFASLLMLSGEFKDLAEVIEEFIGVLKSVDLDSLNEDKKRFLKMFIDAFMQDIKKWYEEVIVLKSANDIHYLDASLLSSIRQIEDFLKENNG